MVSWRCTVVWWRPRWVWRHTSGSILLRTRRCVVLSRLQERMAWPGSCLAVPSLVGDVMFRCFAMDSHLILYEKGSISQTLTYPFDVLRRKMQVIGLGQGALGYQYNSALDAARVIFKTEGIRGMYRGLWPNLCECQFFGRVFSHA